MGDQKPQQERRRFYYDASAPPDADYWLGLAPRERNLAAVEHHELDQPHAVADSQHMHAVAHAAIETQLVEGDLPQVRAALERLVAGGVARHDAVHALGMVFMEQIYDLLRREEVGAQPTEAEANAAYVARIDELTVESYQELADAVAERGRRNRRNRTKRRARQQRRKR
jgi:hypothetical protein